jgi:hypothetical protein
MFAVFRRVVVFGVAGLLSTSVWADLPATYDLRDYGWITPTEDQGQLGTCWAFATTTVYQSSLLRNGLASDPASPALDLSIWHLATRNGNELDLTYPYDGWGGLHNYSVGYWTRGAGEWKAAGDSLSAGGGAVMVSTNPLNVYPTQAVDNHENLAPYVPPAVEPLAPYHLEQSFMLKQSNSGPLTLEFRDQVKQNVAAHGATAIAMWAGGEVEHFSDFYNATDHTFRYTGTSAQNHAVTVAGWDDNKVVTVNGVTSTGAWLIQNSWGTDFGDDGYFWVAYDDTKMGAMTLSVDVGLGGIYSPTVLQNQIFAPTATLGGGAGNEAEAASKMLSPTDEMLLALGLYVGAGSQFSISIYDDWNDGPEGEAMETLNNLSVDSEGYIEFTLNSPLMLHGGDAVYIVVDFGNGLAQPIFLDSKSLTLEGVSSFAGLSWYSLGDGEWTDLSEDGDGIFFLKGLTAVPEPGTTLLVLVGLVFVGWRVRGLSAKFQSTPNSADGLY